MDLLSALNAQNAEKRIPLCRLKVRSWSVKDVEASFRLTEETALENRESMRITYVVSKLYGRILDVGCNSGWLLDEIDETWPMDWGCEWDYRGVDISKELIEKAKIDHPTRAEYFQVAPSGNLPFEAEYFDCVFIGEVVEHLQDPMPTLIEAHRVLKRGGLLIVTTPLEWQGYNPEHVKEYGMQELKALLTKAGFKVESMLLVSQNSEKWYRLIIIAEGRKQ